MFRVGKYFCLCMCAMFLPIFGSGCGANPGGEKISEKPGAVEKKNQNYFIDDVTLNSGFKMPVLGLGTWTLSDDDAEECVFAAIKDGYRLIDTARYYGNERGVGKGVRKAIDAGLVTREEIFVTSKIMPGDYRNPDKAIENSVETLDLGYVDLMLIHQPGANDLEVYKALERGVRAGKIRSIGISNYYTPGDFNRIMSVAEIVPAVVQNENHLFYQNTELKNFLEQYGTFVEAWYPFGGRGNTQKSFDNEVIREIAKAHGKTPAQIILRWQVQAGYIAVPGSKNPEHIAENFDIFDFELSGDETEKISGLNQGKRFENW